MGTTADKLAYLNGTKTAIKNAIVAKGVAVPDGTTFRAYAEKIGSIVKVPSLSNPGSAGDLRSGKQLAGADGSVITGTLAEAQQATPSISVSSGGLITASVTQSGGIVPAGSKSATQQLTTQGAKTVTPGTTNQTAVASGRYTTGDVVVSGDANLVPENIAEGVSIFGVQGAYAGAGGGGYSPLLDLGFAEEQGTFDVEFVSRVPISDANWQYCIFMATNGRPPSIYYCFAFDENGELASVHFANSPWSIEVGVNEIIISAKRDNVGQLPPYCYAVFTGAQ